MPALPIAHANLSYGVELGLIFDALGENVRTDLRGEDGDGADQRLLLLVSLDALRETGIEFDQIRLQHQNVSQAGKAGTGVVHSNPGAPRSQPVQGATGDLVIRYRFVLGDFDDDAAQIGGGE